MSLRQMFAGSIVKPGLNPLVAPTPTYLYNLFAWGAGANGNLGLGNQTYYSSPKQVGSLYWNFVSPGTNSTLAIKNDGTLWSWGQNGGGQLGLGNTTAYSSPKQIGALTNWLFIQEKSSSSCAVKTDGTLWTWGQGTNGELGLGNTTSYSSPKQVGALTNWTTLPSVKGQFSLALRTDGTLWSWGANSQGQLGLGDIVKRSSPTQVGSLTNWLSASGGNYNSFATKTDGTLWSWGSNNFGGLGLGNTTAYSSPKQIGSLTNWLKVSSGYSFALAIKTDGTLWGWGINNGGQLGLGNSTYAYSSPKQVGSLTTWSKISGAQYSSFAIKTDGTLWAWGYNNQGQLGLNVSTAIKYSSPKQVGSLTTWGSVNAGDNSIFALG